MLCRAVAVVTVQLLQHDALQTSRCSELGTVAGAPVFVPWQDHPAEPKFLCDVMTEGLAKQLRLYGVDAAAVESKGKHARHLVYRSSPHHAQHYICT